MKFTIHDPKVNGTYKDKPLSYFNDFFSEQWRAASQTYCAAAKLEVGKSVNVCGITITRTE